MRRAGRIGINAFRPPSNPIAREAKRMATDPNFVLEPTKAIANRGLANFYEAEMTKIANDLNNLGSSSSDKITLQAEMNALALRKAQHQFYNKDEEERQSFVNDFNCWIQGKSAYNNNIHLTPWKNAPLVGRDFVTYKRNHIDSKYEYERVMAILRLQAPTDLRSAWFYYKYIVRSEGWNPDTFLSEWNSWALPGWSTGQYSLGVDGQDGKNKAPPPVAPAVRAARDSPQIGYPQGDPGTACEPVPGFDQGEPPSTVAEEEKQNAARANLLNREDQNPEKEAVANQEIDADEAAPAGKAEMEAEIEEEIEEFEPVILHTAIRKEILDPNENTPPQTRKESSSSSSSSSTLQLFALEQNEMAKQALKDFENSSKETQNKILDMAEYTKIIEAQKAKRIVWNETRERWIFSGNNQTVKDKQLYETYYLSHNSSHPRSTKHLAAFRFYEQMMKLPSRADTDPYEKFLNWDKS